MMPTPPRPPSRTASVRGGARFTLTMVLVLGLVLAGVWYGFLRDAGTSEADVPLTPPLERGPLRVTVNESGNLESLTAKKIVNLVDGRTTIDYVMGMGGAGFKFNNPRAVGTCGCGSSFAV